MTYQEKLEMTQEALTMLVRHEPFLLFTEHLREMQRRAMADACNTQNLLSHDQTVASLGEMRAYMDMLALIDDFTHKTLD